ncbi:MAG TPA: caspase family protein, partial [Isosphaeraceae bacterium]|nr:caspase family protein [Isosphaeraceae bacterium]
MRQLGPLLLGLAFSSVALAADTPEKPILVLDSGGHTAIVAKVLFTRDGKQLISVSVDKTIRLWDVASGAPLRVLRPPIRPIAGNLLLAAALTPDGRTLAAGGGAGWRLGEVPIYLIDLATGRILRVLKGHTNGIISLAFSPDGERLASGSHDRTSRIWSAVSGRCERVLEGHEDVVWDVAFAPDGRHLATASFDKTGRIWSLADGRCEAVLRGHEKEVRCVAWRPDGLVVATGGDDGSIRQWSPEGTALRGFEHLGGRIISLTFSADSRTLLFTRGLPPFTCSLLDLATGEERVRFGLHSNTVQDGALSPDGTLAATTGGNDNETFIWRLTDAAVVHRIASHGRLVWAVAWDPDGESLAWGNTGKSISHNDRGPLERAFRLAGLELSDELSPDLRRATPTLGTLRLELAGTALVVKEGVDTVTTIKMADPRNRILCYTLLPGDHVAVGADAGLYLFDARSGKQLRTFVGHTGTVWAIAPSPDGRYLLSGSNDQTLRIWDLPSQASTPLLSIFVAGDDWVAWSPAGYYAASPGGEQLMGWHVNNGPDAMASYYPASQFRKTLYRPDVIKRLLGTGNVTKALAAADAASGQNTREIDVAQIMPPKVAITTPTVAKLELNGNSLEVKAVASSVGDHAVTTLRLLLDGRPAPEGLKIFTEPKLGEVDASWTVEVPPGSHRLTVQASNAVSKAVSDPVEVVTAKNDNPAAASGSLYVLAVGINDYPDKRLKLDCAAPDAQSLRKAFLTNSSKLFRGVEVKLLLNGQATRASILEGLQWLSSSVKPGDMAVVFYAGHGDCKIEGQFYLVPVDANLRDL